MHSTPSAVDLAASCGVDIDAQPWADLERAALLIARRATEGTARTSQARAALELIGSALQTVKDTDHGDTTAAAEFIDGTDMRGVA